MSKQIILAILVIFSLSHFCHAETVKMSDSATGITSPTPKYKMRFITDNNKYVGSFISSTQGINYKKVQKELSSHFSKQMKQPVSGSIRENTKEGFEVMFPIYTMENKYIGSVRIGNDFFIHGKNFYYHIGELLQSLENALGIQVQIFGIREKGDNSRQETVRGGDGLMHLKL